MKHLLSADARQKHRCRTLLRVNLQSCPRICPRSWRNTATLIITAGAGLIGGTTSGRWVGGQMGLEYGRIEEQLAAALPEIRPAAERYWLAEGKPGEDCGPYIFFEQMFATYVEILIAMKSSPRRDYLLGRAFQFVEEMLASSDLEVANLAYVGLLEWRAEWWYVRAGAFIGPGAAACLDRFYLDWRRFKASGVLPTAQQKSSIIDLYDVRSIIKSELASDGVEIESIPGLTYPNPKSAE